MPAADPFRSSLLSRSAWWRLGGALMLSALLWTCIGWAVSLA